MSKINNKFKLNLLLKIEQINFLKDNDPKLLSNITFEDIKASSDNKKFIYLNKQFIHYLLYEIEEIISIKSNKSKNLNDYFYLALLIDDSREVINYEYPIEYIEEIYKYQQKEDNILIKIIFSEIILTLINNYKGSEIYEEYVDLEKLDEIQKNNNIIIQDFKKNFGSVKINFNLKNNQLEHIYVELINYLLKLDNWEYICDILNKMDLESINLTEIMYKELTNKLNENNIIKDINDLFTDDQKIVNYYYILLKYVYKDSIYIYNIPFFCKSRKIILKSIKKGNLEINPRDKIKFVINKLVDSKYYEDIYNNKIINNNNNNNINNNQNYNDSSFNIFDSFNDSHKNDLSRSFIFTIFNGNNKKNKNFIQDLYQSTGAKLYDNFYTSEIFSNVEFSEKTFCPALKINSKIKENNTKKLTENKNYETEKFEIISFRKKFNNKECDISYKLPKFIKYQEVYFEKINTINNKVAYIINKDIVVFIKNNYKDNELNELYKNFIDIIKKKYKGKKILDKPYKDIIEKRNFKTIIEIPNKRNSIVKLSVDSNKSKNIFLIYNFKIIFDDNNIKKLKDKIYFDYNSNDSDFYDVSFNTDKYFNQDESNEDSNFSNIYNNNNIYDYYYDTKYDNNGILLVYQYFDKNIYNHKKSYYNYFSNKTFEIKNICPIFNVIENEKIYETLFFFAIGNEGNNQVRKIFKIDYDYDDNNNQLKIKYINDIIIDIKEEIKTIRQFKSGRFLISCPNDENYIYSYPNLQYPLLLEERERAEILFDSFES